MRPLPALLCFSFTLLCCIFPGRAQELSGQVEDADARLIEFLKEDGLLDLSPERNAPLTRYELAVALHKLYDRMKMGAVAYEKYGYKVDPEELKALIAKVGPELKAMGAQVEAFEKAVDEALPNLDKELKALDQEVKGEEKKVKDLAKKYDAELKAMKEDQGRTSFSGSARTVFETSSFFKTGQGDLSTSSTNNITDGMSLNFKAVPKMPRRDQRLELSGNLIQDAVLIDKEEQGQQVQAGGSLGILYNAQGQTITEVRAGDISSGWSFLSLPLFGKSMQGYKVLGTHKRKSFELVGAKLQNADAANLKFAEHLHGLTLFMSYKGFNQVRFSYFEDTLDADSILVDEAKKEDAKPDTTQVASVFVQHSVREVPGLTLWAEYGTSRFKQMQHAPFIKGDSCGNRETCFLDPPVKVERSDTILGQIIFTKKFFNNTTILYRQNPGYHNRHGGITGLLGSVGGFSFDFAGINVSELIAGGGLSAIVSLNNCSAPPMRIRNIGTLLARVVCNPFGLRGFNTTYILVSGTETEVTPLSSLVPNLLRDQAGISLEGHEFEDQVAELDQRKNKLGLRVVFPTISYNPSAKTSFAFSYLNVKVLVQDTIRGDLAKGQAPGQADSCDDPEFCAKPANVTCPASSKLFLFLPKTEDRYFFGCAVINANDPKSERIELYQVDQVNGEQVGTLVGNKFGELSNGETIRFEPEGEEVIEVGLHNHTDPDDFRLVVKKDKKLKILARIFTPKFTLRHNFSPKLRYSGEWSQNQVRIPSLELLGIGGQTLQDIVPTFETNETKLSHKLSYQVTRNMDFELFYETTTTRKKDSTGATFKDRQDFYRFRVSFSF